MKLSERATAKFESVSERRERHDNGFSAGEFVAISSLLSDGTERYGVLFGATIID